MNPEELRSWRRERQYTQQQMADALGVTVGAYNHWESGRRTIPGPVERILQVYRSLGIMAPSVLHGLLTTFVNAAQEAREKNDTPFEEVS